MDLILKLGWVGYSWIAILFLSTAVLFWIPLVFSSFKEKEYVCPECGTRIKI